jgi:hypothetical protein
LSIAESPSLPEYGRRTHQAYAWGHLGHALQRRGDRAAAETAFAECIELWRTSEDDDKEDPAVAERLATIVPSFPLPEPRRRRSKSGKRAPARSKA